MTHEQHAFRQRQFGLIAGAIERSVGRDEVYWVAADRARLTTADQDEEKFWDLLLATDLAMKVDAGDATPEQVAQLLSRQKVLDAAKSAMAELAAQERQREDELRAQLVAAGGDPDRPRPANDND